MILEVLISQFDRSCLAKVLKCNFENAAAAPNVDSSTPCSCSVISCGGRDEIISHAKATIAFVQARVLERIMATT